MPRVTVSVHCPPALYTAVEEYVESADSPEDATISNTFSRLTRAGLPPEYRPEDREEYSPPSPAKDAIREALADGAMHREDIAEATGRSLNVVASLLTEMDEVESQGDGVWRLA